MSKGIERILDRIEPSQTKQNSMSSLLHGVAELCCVPCENYWSKARLFNFVNVRFNTSKLDMLATKDAEQTNER